MTGRDLGPALDHLRRRITAMHQLWRMGVADLTAGQVNHRERPGVLPIAFTLVHCVTGEDTSMGSLLALEGPLWDLGGWSEKTGVRRIPGRGTPMDEAERTRIADLEAWRRYQDAVFERTEQALAALGPLDLERELFGGTIPPAVEGAFITFVAEPGGPIRVLDGIECFVYQHGLRHLGELEHARALVGLRGLT